MEIIIICAILGCIPGAIASSKGRSFGLWWLYGALLFIVALIHSLCISKDLKALENEQIAEGLVKCPYCAEMIKPEAIKCKHCGSDVEKQRKSVVVNDISKFNVKIHLGKSVMLDEYKIDEIAEEMFKGNSGKDKIAVIEAYKGQIDEIKTKLPDSLHKDFENLMAKAIKG